MGSGINRGSYTTLHKFIFCHQKKHKEAVANKNRAGIGIASHAVVFWGVALSCIVEAEIWKKALNKEIVPPPPRKRFDNGF